MGFKKSIVTLYLLYFLFTYLKLFCVKIHIHVVFTLQCSRDFALLQLENLHNFWNLATTRI